MINNQAKERRRIPVAFRLTISVVLAAFVNSLIRRAVTQPAIQTWMTEVAGPLSTAVFEYMLPILVGINWLHLTRHVGFHVARFTTYSMLVGVITVILAVWALFGFFASGAIAYWTGATPETCVKIALVFGIAWLTINSEILLLAAGAILALFQNSFAKSQGTFIDDYLEALGVPRGYYDVE